jgi:hypothetical protein
MPDARVRNRRYGRTRLQSPPRGRIDGSPEGWIWARWGVVDLPPDAETGIRLWEGDRPDGMAYRTYVNSSKDLEIGCVMIARR